MFHNYFSNLENELFQTANDDIESFCLNNNVNANNESDYNEELDFPITVEEILSAIKQLKRNKSHGIDNVSNEYFIECSDILSPYLSKLFNAVLDSCCFPDVWSEGIVIPQCLFALKGLLKMKKYKVMLHICTSLYKYNFCSVLFCSTN